LIWIYSVNRAVGKARWESDEYLPRQGVNMPASMEEFRRRITVDIDDSHMTMTWIYSSSRAVGKALEKM